MRTHENSKHPPTYHAESSVHRAGVIGLTTALVLSKHKNLNITVLAKHMPGDYDIEYASPWAGANYLPVGKPGSSLQQFERETWAELERLCTVVAEAGIHFQHTAIYNRKKDADSATGQWFQELTKEDSWFKDVVPNVSGENPCFFYASLSIFSSLVLFHWNTSCSQRLPLSYLSHPTSLKSQFPFAPIPY